MKVYAMSDPRTNEVRYVGITANTLPKRRSLHVYRAKRSDRNDPVCLWIRELIADGLRPNIFLLEETDDPLREHWWIAYFRSFGSSLTNGNGGGLGNEFIPTEVRKKIADTLTGRKLGPHSPEHKARISASNTGKTHSEETRAKLREARLKQDNPAKKLTDAQAESIRRDYHYHTISQKALAEKYGVSQGTISNIILHKFY